MKPCGAKRSIPPSRSARVLEWALPLAVGLLVLAVGVLCCVPPVSRDALTHHLAVPKLYLQHGRMLELPFLTFSYFPMNLDLLYLAALSAGSEIAPKFIHFAFALATAALVFRYLRRWVGGLWAWLGVLLFLSLPVVVRLSISVYVDHGLVFFSTAALMSLLHWLVERTRWRYLVVSAVCTGLALGTKYNGLITLFLLGVLILICYRPPGNEPTDGGLEGARGGRRLLKAAGWALAYGGIAMLVFSPWMIRNFRWTGNPVYPLFDKVFEAPADNDGGADPAALVRRTYAAEARSNQFMVRLRVYRESAVAVALMPVRIFFQGEDDNPRLFDGRLSPLLFFLPFGVFLGWRQSPPALRTGLTACLVFGWLYILCAFVATDMRARYVAPALPALVILAVIGAARLWKSARERFPVRFGRWLRILLAGCLALGIAANGKYAIQQFARFLPLAYISGELDRDAYRLRFWPEYALFRFANRELPAGSRILAVFFGNRGYYSDHEVWFGNARFEALVRERRSVEEVRQTLAGEGFTHLAINLDMFRQWVVPGLDEPARALSDRFLGQPPAFSSGPFALYDLH